jgi:hypothetical protein
MFYLVVLNEIRGPANILTCALCLGLLFFEAVFGICAGCKVYNLVHQEKVKHCPGGVCDLTRGKDQIQHLNFIQKAIFTFSLLALFYLAFGDVIKFLMLG